jgi:signal peptidase I
LRYYVTNPTESVPLCLSEGEDMRAYDGIKAGRGREATLETSDFVDHARKLLSKGISIHLRMSGATMRPAIEDGDIVTIDPVTDVPIKQGDIVLYHSTQDTAVIHRVVRLERGGPQRLVITRGDSASQNDLPVPIERVLGRIRLVERAGQPVALKKPARRILDRLNAWLRRYWPR